MNEDRVRVDGFSNKTDAPSVKTGDIAHRPTKNGRGRKAKQNSLFAKDGVGEEKQLRVVYSCVKHSDAVMEALIELLAQTLRERKE